MQGALFGALIIYVTLFGHLTMFLNNGIVKHPSGQCVLLQGEMCAINETLEVTDQLIMECAKFCVDHRGDAK